MEVAKWGERNAIDALAFCLRSLAEASASLFIKAGRASSLVERFILSGIPSHHSDASFNGLLKRRRALEHCWSMK